MPVFSSFFNCLSVLLITLKMTWSSSDNFSKCQEVSCALLRYLLIILLFSRSVNIVLMKGAFSCHSVVSSNVCYERFCFSSSESVCFFCIFYSFYDMLGKHKSPSQKKIISPNGVWIFCLNCPNNYNKNLVLPIKCVVNGKFFTALSDTFLKVSHINKKTLYYWQIHIP